ncbi:MAG: DegT/DnrJ/EryC1/StrS family aminotransferase [Nitrososphaerota archaeon]|jgi:perosamine synthetase|nr:DegT/DnrJ/EryC1/StrS family aminotransferase [Nitrososphaerota archaeon]
MNKINQMEPWLGFEEKQAVIDYLDGGGWLTEFKKTREFEQKISEFIKSNYVSVVNNGTSSLVIALMALDIGIGDEVIVPDFTMIASSNAIVLAGAKPVLVDIDPTNLCLDLEKAEEAITPKTKAIMYVSINGRSHDMNNVLALAKKYNLFVIEDAAQALGSTFSGKSLGTFGDIGSISFSAPKIITTGQGGALFTDNSDLFRKIALIRDFGRPKSGVDYHEVIGFNAKFTDLQAVIGIEQMKKLPWRVQRKKEIYKIYFDCLSDVGSLIFINTNLKETSPWFIDVLVETKRAELISFLNERGIGSRVFYPSIHTQPPYSWVKGDFPKSDAVSQQGLWLPSSSFLSDDTVLFICNVIKDFFKN